MNALKKYKGVEKILSRPARKAFQYKTAETTAQYTFCYRKVYNYERCPFRIGYVEYAERWDS